MFNINFHHKVFLILLGLFIVACSYGQSSDSTNITDSIKINTDTIKKKTSTNKNDDNNTLKSKVDYSAKDSIMLSIKEQKVYLYGKAEIKYEAIILKAEYMEINFAKNELYACGKLDSLGREFGTPVFTEGTQTINSKSLTYNFKTKKGIIKELFTKEGDNYLHGSYVKKMPSNEIHIRNGKYTTCENKDPHYDVRFWEANVIPNDKIVTGPFLMFVENIPTPAGFFLGYFPNKKGQKSGILIPTYGESANRGFFFENGGYYFGFSDYIDLALRGDIYTRGSWALKTLSNYNKKYAFNGNFSLNYATNIISEKELPDYSKSKDFFIRWSHTQDPKARPNSTFSANVNAGSSKFNTFNPGTTQDHLSNTFQSSISYSRNWKSKYFFSVSARHDQNTISRQVNLSVPELSFNTNRFYPFRKKNQVGKLKWYENIGLTYSSNARNDINTYDSLLFTPKVYDMMKYGIRHNVPISNNMNILKYFFLTNTINYNERWYFQTIRKSFQNDPFNPQIDTVKGFATTRDFNFNSSVNTKIYGMVQFKKGPLKAIRHVITPAVGITYQPDFSTDFWGYYRNVENGDPNNPVRYSIFENTIYGSPSLGKSGLVNMSISNNFEMKVRNRKDTVGDGFKKVVLIDNFTISTNYDIFKDTMNWSRIILSGRTKLLKNLDVTYASAFDPYIIDTLGRNLNKSEWKENGRLARITNSDWAFNLNYNLNTEELFKKKADKTKKEDSLKPIINTDNYITPKLTLNIAYTMRYTKNYPEKLYPNQKSIIQTLGLNGELKLTNKWRLSFTSGYDFENKDFSYTSVDIYRDLHCWEMKFNWIPFGIRKSYNFSLGIKASALQDLKLTKKKDWRDNLGQ